MKLAMESADIVREQTERLMELFPSCVTREPNGKLTVDFDALKAELSDSVVEGRNERYRIDWPGKLEARHEANEKITKTLRPDRASSKDFDTTQNLYIEGDNLDALKLLRKAYLGKVKMIYIDPPYNTGHDFTYDDKFARTKEEEERASGKLNEEGYRTISRDAFIENSEARGQYHSVWLTMMYPRLKLAREFLRDDGVIFISIDDNEVANLCKICDEIFGENKRVAIFPWRKRTAKADVPFGVSQDYEWILCYAKTDQFIAGVEGKPRKYYTTDDFPGRPWRVHDLTKQTTAAERPNSYFTIVNPKNGDEYPANPNRTWALTAETYASYYKEDRIVFPGDYDFLNIKNPVLRYWQEEDMKKSGDRFGKIALSTKFPDSIGMSQDGTRDIASLFDKKVFSFPKPVSLIRHLIHAATGDTDIVLDFFSGSGTTAHAVMKENAEDGASRHFILVQFPETVQSGTDAAQVGFKTICEIGEERIRRSGEMIKTECEAKGGAVPDIGFRVLKIDSSNMEDIYYTPEETISAFGNLVLREDPVKKDRTEEDLIFQAVQDTGILPLSSRMERTEFNGVPVWYVYLGEEPVLAAFLSSGSSVTTDTLTKLVSQYSSVARVVVRESTFASDTEKANAELRLREIDDGVELRTL